MKIIVSFSGGKDSLACLLWAVKQYGNKSITAVFCDTGWEHEWTYKHIDEVTKRLDVSLVTLHSEGFMNLTKRKKRFASTKARFCTEFLKTRPMIDYVLDEVKDHCIIIQGIRAEESAARSKMNSQCTFFRYYFEPYGTDKKGKPKFHTYRKKDIIAFKEQYADDVLRPIFDWKAGETMEYIMAAGFSPNPLYFHDMSRVGCFPCVMCRHGEIKAIALKFPDYVLRLIDAEKSMNKPGERGSTFFPPDYIPHRFCSRTLIKKDKKTGKDKIIGIATVEDVIKYVTRDNGQESLFEEPKTDRRCMSFYGICE